MWLLLEAAIWVLKSTVLYSAWSNCETDGTELHSANGIWLEKYWKSKPRVSQGKGIGYFSVAKSVSWSYLNRTCFSVIEEKIEGRETQKQKTIEDCCNKVLVEHLKWGIGWCPLILDFRQSLTAKDFYASIKNNPYIKISLCNCFWAFENGGLCITIGVTPKLLLQYFC